jgi:hypothetical protein
MEKNKISHQVELIKWKCCSDILIKWIIYYINVSIYYFMRNNINNISSNEN